MTCCPQTYLYTDAEACESDFFGCDKSHTPLTGNACEHRCVGLLSPCRLPLWGCLLSVVGVVFPACVCLVSAADAGALGGRLFRVCAHMIHV